MPAVSVIIPVYGVEKYLRECLDSVVGQTLKEIEIIIIDDGSKDLCPEIIDEYAKNDSRIIAIHQKNAGYGAACNVGLNLAKGEYVAICEPDDYIAPKMYEEMYNKGKTQLVDIVRCSFFRVGEGYLKKSECPSDTAVTLEERPQLLLEQPSVWAALYRHDFLEEKKIRFVEAKGAGQVDINFKFETYFASHLIACVDEGFYFYRINENSSVKKGDNPEIEAERIKETAVALRHYPERLAWFKEYWQRSQIDIFIWAFFERLKPIHHRKLMENWHGLFSEMDENLISKSHLFTSNYREIFNFVKTQNFFRMKCFFLNWQRKKLIRLRLNSTQMSLKLLQGKKTRFHWSFALLKRFKFEIFVGGETEQ